MTLIRSGERLTRDSVPGSRCKIQPVFLGILPNISINIGCLRKILTFFGNKLLATTKVRDCRKAH